jgi:hypothetical protein
VQRHADIFTITDKSEVNLPAGVVQASFPFVVYSISPETSLLHSVLNVMLDEGLSSQGGSPVPAFSGWPCLGWGESQAHSFG